MTTSEKVAHLKGVMEGMEYDTTTKEGKLVSLIVDILDDLTIEVAEIEDDLDTLYDFADELDEDLGDVEADLYGDPAQGHLFLVFYLTFRRTYGIRNLPPGSI